MKINNLIFIAFTALFISCIGEDIEVVEGASTSELERTINFERKLTSIAIDESPVIRLRNGNGDPIDLETSSFDASFSTNNSNVTIDSNGKINITPEAANQEVTIIVDFSIKENSDDTTLEVPETIEDVIIIGAITISELEASGIEGNIEEIIRNGFEPQLTIQESITSIDINSTEELNLTLQDKKKEVIEIDSSTITWSSDDDDIISIIDGVLTPQSEGTTNIRASVSFNGETVVSEDKTITVSDETVIIDEPDPVDDRILLGNGTLQSNSGYRVTGSFEIYREGDKNFISLSDDFSIGRLPDLVLYLSNSTSSNAGASVVAAPETQPTPLRGSGAQILEIPSSINVNGFENVLFFCRAFSARVGFGVINR